MINTIQLSQEDIKLIILDYYQKQGITKESVNFYEKVKENKDESEIYAIVSEKEKPLKITEPEILWTPEIKKSDTLCMKCGCSIFGYSGPNLNNPG
jgi:hypothetical protein